jgi:hypothetical protein
MIRAICWKEWREQRIVIASVLAFGALALVLTAQFTDESPGGTLADGGGGPRELMAVALAYLAGAVAGAILLADEKEVGTLEFLDSLPTRRRAVWVAKMTAGLFFAIGQSVLLALLAVRLGCFDRTIGAGPFGVLVGLVGLLAFAWGAFGGGLARSTLGAVFQGSIAAILAGAFLAVPFTLFFGQRGMGRPFGLPLLAFYCCWVVVGLLGSAAFFTTPDRQRAPRQHRSSPDRETFTHKPWLAGSRALVWLTLRQAVFVAMGTAAVGVLVGVGMLAPDVLMLFVWPEATLALGVLAGVTAVGEEQVRGVARFWAERRLPLGRMWLVKTLAHFSLAVAGSLILFGFIYAASPTPVFRSRLVHELRPELWRFLFLGLVYGFVVGHLAGMIFRKTIVAGLVATVVAATLAGLVLPSLIGGGAAAWQIWGPAAILLLTDRLLLYPWATDRIATRGPLVRVIGGGIAAVAALGIGLAYRVVEVADVPDRLAESGYQESLPIKDVNQGSLATKAAAAQFHQAAQDAVALYRSPRGGGGGGGNGRRPVTFGEPSDPLGRAARTGWTTYTEEALGPWLDAVFAGKWVESLDDLANKPIGMYEDPRDLDYFSPPDNFVYLRDMILAVRARGLQRQSAGDPATYPRLLRNGLAAVRTGRNRGGVLAVSFSLDCEEALFSGLTEWADRLDGRPDLLRQVVTELGRHETEMPTGTDDAFWAEQVLLRNTMERVASWLPRILDPRPNALEGTSPQVDAEANLVAFAWNVPWERARRERLLRVETNKIVDLRQLSRIHGPVRWQQIFDRTAELAAADEAALTRRRLVHVAMALRLYRAENGGPAPTLSALVPDYIPTLVTDPYTGRAFGYRVSAGERIATGSVLMPRDAFITAGFAASIAHPVGGLNGIWAVFRDTGPPRFRGAGLFGPTVPTFTAVPPGYGVLWSAGPDGQDDGGLRTGPRGNALGAGDDSIVLIPPPGVHSKNTRPEGPDPER